MEAITARGVYENLENYTQLSHIVITENTEVYLNFINKNIIISVGYKLYLKFIQFFLRKSEKKLGSGKLSNAENLVNKGTLIVLTLGSLYLEELRKCISISPQLLILTICPFWYLCLGLVL